MSATETDIPARPQPGAAAPAQADSGRWLEDTPLRHKVSLLVVLAAMFGMAVGLLEGYLGFQVWPLMLGLTLGVGGLIFLGQWWVSHPFDRLVHRLEEMAGEARRSSIEDLPTHRTDEVGRIAAAMRKVYAAAIREHYEAKRIRRTLDARVREETQKATMHLQRMAMRDPLTELGNRRFLDELLEPVTKASRSTGTDLICVMLDMDNFKQVNDTLGHAAGDELLIMLARLVESHIRRGQDIAVRLGGDEFVVLMPGGTVESAGRTADQLRIHFGKQSRTRFPEGPQADLSVGIASLHRDASQDGAALMAKADEHLYAAKSAGKGVTRGV